MVGDNKQQLGKLEASLAPAKAEVGAVVKADQKWKHFIYCLERMNFLVDLKKMLLCQVTVDSCQQKDKLILS